MRFLHGRMRSNLPPPAAALALLTLLAAGCDGCPGSNKPYTPYTLSDKPSAAPSIAPSGSAAAAGDAGAADGAAPEAPAFPVVLSAPPPGDGKSWPLEAGSADAPVGRSFGAGLVLDADGDGKKDLLAWSRSPDLVRGEIWFASGASPSAGHLVAALPDGVAVPGCATAQLSQIGPHTVVFDAEGRCGGRSRGGRWIAVLRLPEAAGGAPEIGLELRLAPPADGETLDVKIDPRDRDGDGRGDALATITLSGAPRPFPAAGASASASLAFYDRPAGLSRDPSEPEASLKAVVAGLVADGRRRTTAPRIAASALALRRLWGMLCDDPSKPAITTSAGPARCGDARLLEDAAMAEVEAALNLGEPVAAMAALARLDALGGRRKDVDALVAKSIPAVPIGAVHRTTAAPAVEPSPAFGPLAFNGGGDLLVRTADKIVRVDRTSFAEAPIDAALRWPSRLAFPASADAPSWRLTGVERRCDEATLIGRFETGGTTADVPLPIATPSRCTPDAHVATELIGASAQGFLFAAGADVVAVPAADPPKPALPDGFNTAPAAAVELGAARSPDGGTLALPTGRGVLVVAVKPGGRAASAKRWTGPELDGASRCVPSNGGDHLACVAAGAAAIYQAK
jgi:hypothetical protein